MVSKEWLWIVDPIDGTTNFVHHRPASVVSVACAHLGEVVVGVIYDPYRDEIFTAQKGKGTFLNGQPAHVSQEASFSEALVGFGIGTKDSVRLPMLDCAREFSAKCRGLRLQGAAAIELAWTAAGRQSVRQLSFLAKMEEQFPTQYHVSTWFFVCGPLAVNTFLLGLAANLHVFKKNNLAFDRVMDMRPDEIPTAGGVFKTAFFMCLLQFLLFNGEAARRGDAFGVDETRMEMLLLGYVIVAASLLLCPFDVLHYKFRMFVLRKLARCFWPFQQFSFKLPTHATPFIEVFMADGMTSLSKFIQDLSVALMLLVMSFTSEPEDLRESYISKLKESPLPYFAASTPYILLVISVGAYPMLMGLARPEQSSFFLLCAVFNSLYSFLWDVVMDWGLGQPKLPRRVAFLRHQLIYRPRKIYYLVIVVDFVLRIMWVAKWWDWMHRGVHFKLVAQVAEVVRRIVWNFVRVEWQCIKLDILATKKLSADTVELDEMIEKVPLMQEHEDDLEDMKPRMRTLSRPNCSLRKLAAPKQAARSARVLFMTIPTASCSFKWTQSPVQGETSNGMK
ncbi:Inositol monophosphatase, metal-binding site [Phytophthora cactorum]|nr:Inositol monophosphatase, metal-binding site [Phytophthora cactorum]